MIVLHPSRIPHRWIDRLLVLAHPALSGDTALAALHAAFIAVNGAVGLLALVSFPLWVALGGGLPPGEAVPLAGLIMPLAAALLASRSGWLLPAAAIVGASLATLIIASMLASGGPLAGPAAALLAAAQALALLLTLAAREHIAVARCDALRERYALVAAASCDLVIEHGPTGAVIWASPAAAALLGTAPETLLGQGLFERVHVADRPAYLVALAEARRGATGLLATLRLRRRNGHGCTLLQAEWRVIVGVNGSGKLATAFRDISDRLAAETAEDEARARASAAIDARSRLSAMIGQDIRTPLIGIVDTARLMLAGREDRHQEGKPADHALFIHETGAHLLDVIDAVLAMEEPGNGHAPLDLATIDIGELIRESRKCLAPRAGQAGVALETRLAPDLPAIHADRRACRRILDTLIASAIGSTQAGGRVTISTRLDRGGLALSVVEAGPGIAETDMTRLGGPLFRSRSGDGSRCGGASLDLAAVHGLVDRLGGRLEVLSRTGHGKTTILRLPIDIPPAARDGGIAPGGPHPAVHPAPLSLVSHVEEKKIA